MTESETATKRIPQATSAHKKCTQERLGWVQAKQVFRKLPHMYANIARHNPNKAEYYLNANPDETVK